jgi:hypothetical protein
MLSKINQIYNQIKLSFITNKKIKNLDIYVELIENTNYNTNQNTNYNNNKNNIQNYNQKKFFNLLLNKK